MAILSVLLIWTWRDERWTQATCKAKQEDNER